MQCCVIVDDSSMLCDYWLPGSNKTFLNFRSDPIWFVIQSCHLVAIVSDLCRKPPELSEQIVKETTTTTTKNKQLKRKIETKWKFCSPKILNLSWYDPAILPKYPLLLKQLFLGSNRNVHSCSNCSFFQYPIGQCWSQKPQCLLVCGLD